MFKRFRIKRSKTTSSSSLESTRHNARFFKRYGMEKEKITLIYEDDIMLLVNISYDGFCLKVSDRVIKSVKIGQNCYFKKFRLFDRQAPIYAQVVWISQKDSAIGFSIDQQRSAPDFHLLIEPVLLPLDIASSFKQIDIGTFDDNDTKILVYRGSYNSEIYIKFEATKNCSESENLVPSSSFTEYSIVEVKMLSANFYLSWTPKEGLSTGTFSYDVSDSSTTFQNQPESSTDTSSDSNVIYFKKHSLNKDSSKSSCSSTTAPRVFKSPYLLSLANIILNKDPGLNQDHLRFFINITENSYLKDKESLLKILGNYYPCCGTSI